MRRATDRDAVLPRFDAVADPACARAARRSPRPAASVFVVVLAAAGAADHDLVLLDRDLDGPVAGPVLGVDGIVLHVGVEPEAVALLAVVERALERARGGAAAGAAAAARGGRALGLRLVLVVGLGLLGLGGGLLGLGGLLLAASSAASRPPRPRGAWPPPRARRRSPRRPRRGGRPPRGGAPAPPRRRSSPCSRLKAWICWTVTSSWWAIHASVRPCRTHPRI